MTFLNIIWMELCSYMEDNIDHNPNQLIQNVENQINIEFNGYIASLEAYAMQSKRLVTYLKRLKNLKWLDTYSQHEVQAEARKHEGSNLVQEKIKELQTALYGNDSSYFQYFQSKINLSFVRNDFYNMNQYFKHLDSIKEILVDSENQDLYTPLKESIRGKIQKYIEDSCKKIDENDFSNA